MRSLIIKSALTSFVIALFTCNTTMAYQGNRVPADKRSTLGLYFTAQETFDYLKWNAGKTLFLDVRDPAELVKSGTPTLIDANVPFKFRISESPDVGHEHVGYEVNQDFAKDVDRRRAAKGLSKADVVILICDCGRRASKAVDLLKETGYSNVATVVDGYKGWRKKKLPWSRKLDKSKLYRHSP